MELTMTQLDGKDALLIGKNIIPAQFQKGHLRYLKVTSDGSTYICFIKKGAQ